MSDFTVQIVGNPLTSQIISGGPAGPMGPQGPTGPMGPQGPAGDTSESLGHRHVQAVPSSIWVINHPLTFIPSVTTVDSTGQSVEGDVRYVSPGVIEVHFAAAFSGEATLS